MRGPVNPLLGAHNKLELEAVIDGEVSQTVLEECIDDIRRKFGEVGNVSSLARSVTFSPAWASGNSGVSRRLQISIASRNGRTTIRAYEDLTALTGGIFGGIMGGGGAAAGFVSFGVIMANLHLPILAASALATALGGSYGVARAAFVYTSRKREKELRTLVENLATKVRAAVEAPPLSRAPDGRRLRR